MARVLAVVAVLLALGMAPVTGSEEPSLETVLSRAAAYVAEFEQKLSSIVAEERYVQESTGSRRGPEQSNVGRRELASDLLLVKPANDARWMEFRDVFEVDGKPLRERDQRLLKLFITPSPDTTAQVDRILAESSRFNIGNVQRNVNTPILALQFLEAANQSRFTFKHTNERKPKVVGPASSADAFRVSTEIWTVAYEERGHPAMIHTATGAELLARGRLWIDPAVGRVLMTELSVEDIYFRASIVVSFQSEPLLGMFVPIEMRERYDGKRRSWRVDGTATYGRFRQFTVNVDEVFAVKKK